MSAGHFLGSQCGQHGLVGNLPSTACACCQRPTIQKWLASKWSRIPQHKDLFFGNDTSQPCRSSLCLLIIDSESVRPSQCCVDQGDSIAAVGVGSHDDCWPIPVRPEQVAEDQHLIRLTRVHLKVYKITRYAKLSVCFIIIRFRTHPSLGCTAIPLGYLSPVTMSRLDLSVTLKATTDL